MQIEMQAVLSKVSHSLGYSLKPEQEWSVLDFISGNDPFPLDMGNPCVIITVTSGLFLTHWRSGGEVNDYGSLSFDCFNEGPSFSHYCNWNHSYRPSFQTK